MYSNADIILQTKVNLLSKLKDRIEIESINTTETIKSLVHLPKAWTNEAIEKRANESGDRKRKQKQHVETEDGLAENREDNPEHEVPAKKQDAELEGGSAENREDMQDNGMPVKKRKLLEKKASKPKKNEDDISN